MTNQTPRDWIETTLGKVCKTNVSSIGKEYEFDRIVYLDTGSITEGRIESLQNFDFSDAPSRAKRLVKENDIIYSTVRPNQKHFGFIQNPDENLVVSTGFTVISSLENKTNPKFIYYFLTQDFITNTLQQTAEHCTSTYPSIRPEHIENLDILLPSLPEQQAIASVLSAFDDKIELLREENKTLEQIGQTIFQEWFGKYSPDRPEELPDGWKVYTLNEVSKLIAGGDSPKNTTFNKTITNTIPVYSNGISNDGLYGYTDRPKITEESVTISARGTIGYISLKLEPFMPIVRLISITPIKKYLSNKYLFLWLKNQNIIGTGTTQQQLTIPDFSTSRIIISESIIMDKFTVILDALYKKISDINFLIKSLAKTRDELLPRLMSGEVRVKG